MTTEKQNQEFWAPKRRGSRRASVVSVVGIVLLVAGLACVGWVGYQLVGTDVVAQRSFDRGTQELHSEWASDPPAAGSKAPTDGARSKLQRVPGSAVALLRVPRFGDDFEVPVVAGTDLKDLSHGVGHYDDTAAPGQVGNFALAGHRITHGQPFAELLKLRKGDRVVVETREAVFTYVMDGSPADLTVDDTAGWVLDPVPGEPGVRPTAAMITLTTCQDLFHSPDRSVGFGHLQSTKTK